MARTFMAAATFVLLFIEKLVHVGFDRFHVLMIMRPFDLPVMAYMVSRMRHPVMLNVHVLAIRLSFMRFRHQLMADLPIRLGIALLGFHRVRFWASQPCHFRAN